MKVYLDLVMLLNFLVDFLLLMGTNRLAGYPPAYGKAAAASVLGAAYSGACMLPGMVFLGNGLWRIVFLWMMAVIAFGWNRSAMQRGAVFVLLSMALGGISVGFGKGSFWILLASAMALWLLCRVSFRGSLGQREYVPVELSWEGRKISLIALRDTGNTLRDPLTGEQVLVAGADVGKELLDLSEHQIRHPVETLASCVLPGMRLIPYTAVGQPGGILLAVRFEGAKIGNTYGNPLVAFAPEAIAKGAVYQMLTGGTV
ncbi:MAG: sigma-E processing peptidase SpoIIGA [Oscillospiraceae bacterium]|nr:sigma-E processing peptidase SpoIIGA [Oscillospiraceae bacterium]